MKPLLPQFNYDLLLKFEACGLSFKRLTLWTNYPLFPSSMIRNSVILPCNFVLLLQQVPVSRKINYYLDMNSDVLFHSIF